MSETQSYIAVGQQTIIDELKSLEVLKQYINQHFHHACSMIHQCAGRVIIMGIGKSGHIGKKIAATLASTGTPAFFVHPGEASHGDLGMITQQDIVLFISYSGETKEILALIPFIKKKGAPIIVMTGDIQSTLARSANEVIQVTIDQEACPMKLAPTTSSTACLIMGDALAIALLKQKNFTQQDFAHEHPGGILGQRLTLQVQDIMLPKTHMPIIAPHESVSKGILEISMKNFGIVAIIDPQTDTLKGVFTDGDLRRMLDLGLDIHTTTVAQVMTQQPKTIAADMLATKALGIMNQHQITVLIITDTQDKMIGIIDLHTLIKSGLINEKQSATP